ncbi:MAG: hypothetical protein VX341_10065 [Bdellovibrionota bacterium]|nr:hypothetical protein [Bdellovibrionota bacterium]
MSNIRVTFLMIFLIASISNAHAEVKTSVDICRGVKGVFGCAAAIIAAGPAYIIEETLNFKDRRVKKRELRRDKRRYIIWSKSKVTGTSIREKMRTSGTTHLIGVSQDGDDKLKITYKDTDYDPEEDKATPFSKTYEIDLIKAIATIKNASEACEEECVKNLRIDDGSVAVEFAIKIKEETNSFMIKEAEIFLNAESASKRILSNSAFAYDDKNIKQYNIDELSEILERLHLSIDELVAPF